MLAWADFSEGVGTGIGIKLQDKTMCVRKSYLEAEE